MSNHIKTIGSIIYATNQGLGILAKEFYDNGYIDKVVIIGNKYPSHPEWYNDNDICKDVDELLVNIHTLLILETIIPDVLDWGIVEKARQQNIKVVLIPMYECTPFPLPSQPDIIVCPSELDYQFYKDSHPYVTTVAIPAHSKVDWTERYKARHFIHNVGHAVTNRNGTEWILKALPYIKSDIKLTLRTQQSLKIPINDSRVEVVSNEVSFSQLWKEGDVFLFPERWNGLSLPLQEAFASGMGIMCGQRFPMTRWLPYDMMIPIEKTVKHTICNHPCFPPVDAAIYNPKDIAKTIDLWYNKRINHLSQQGRKWAQSHSWKMLAPIYTYLLS